MLCRNLRQTVKNLCSEIQCGCTLQYVEAFLWCTRCLDGRLQPGFLRHCREKRRGGTRTRGGAGGQRSPEGVLHGSQRGPSAVPGAAEGAPAEDGGGVGLRRVGNDGVLTGKGTRPRENK